MNKVPSGPLCKAPSYQATNKPIYQAGLIPMNQLTKSPIDQGALVPSYQFGNFSMNQ